MSVADNNQNKNSGIAERSPKGISGILFQNISIENKEIYDYNTIDIISVDVFSELFGETIEIILRLDDWPIDIFYNQHKNVFKRITSGYIPARLFVKTISADKIKKYIPEELIQTHFSLNENKYKQICVFLQFYYEKYQNHFHKIRQRILLREFVINVKYPIKNILQTLLKNENTEKSIHIIMDGALSILHMKNYIEYTRILLENYNKQNIEKSYINLRNLLDENIKIANLDNIKIVYDCNVEENTCMLCEDDEIKHSILYIAHYLAQKNIQYEIYVYRNREVEVLEKKDFNEHQQNESIEITILHYFVCFNTNILLEEKYLYPPEFCGELNLFSSMCIMRKIGGDITIKNNSIILQFIAYSEE